MTSSHNNSEDKRESITLEEIEQTGHDDDFYVSSKGHVLPKIVQGSAPKQSFSNKKSRHSHRGTHHHRHSSHGSGHHEHNSSSHSSHKSKSLSHKDKQTKKKMGKLKKVLLTILIVIVSLIIILFATYLLLKALGKSNLLEHNENARIEAIDGATSLDNGKTIIYNGDTYTFNEDLVSIVIMGVDKSQLGTTTYGDAGQADAIYIFAYDTVRKKSYLIPVSRDTISEVNVYSTSGQDMGLDDLQICLAYSYGDGKEKSCQNTLDALSRTFYNIPFNKYVALNWDCIGPLTDVIGGVQLTTIETVSDSGITIPAGTNINLKGQQAWAYVKYRNIEKYNSNADRLARQKQFLNIYISKLIPTIKQDLSTVTKLYNIADKYMYTNVGLNEVIYIGSEIVPSLYTFGDIEFVTIDGKTKMGKQFSEFRPDQTSLYESILKVFYIKQD